MTTRPLRIAVLISGTGSNLAHLIHTSKSAGNSAFQVCHVISNRAQAGGLAHARAAGIECSVIKHSSHPQAGAQDRAIAETLQQAKADLVVMAGYMRILGAPLVQQFAGRMINLHPSLLPRYRGLNTYQRALEAGDTEHGASVHFVTAELDGGPVIAQVRIAIEPQDDAHSLQQRLAPREHALLGACVELFSQRRVTMMAARPANALAGHTQLVAVDGCPLSQALQLDEHNELS